MLHTTHSHRRCLICVGCKGDVPDELVRVAGKQVGADNICSPPTPGYRNLELSHGLAALGPIGGVKCDLRQPKIAWHADLQVWSRVLRRVFAGQLTEVGGGPSACDVGDVAINAILGTCIGPCR